MNNSGLILTADDFGLTRDVNDAVIDAVCDGPVESVSLIPVGPAFEDAVERCRKRDLAVGIHLGLIYERPLSSVNTIPSLVTKQGRFYRDYRQFCWNYGLGTIKMNQLETEIRAQIERVVDTKLTISHLDSHQHLHMLPGIFSIVLKLMREYRISNVRIPDEWFRGRSCVSPSVWGLKLLSKWARRQTGTHSFTSNDRFWGVGLKGPPSDRLFKRFLSNASFGISEIGIHISTQRTSNGSGRYDSGRKLQKMYKWVMSSRFKQMLEAFDTNQVSWKQLDRTPETG